jgi:hypothetical protein
LRGGRRERTRNGPRDWLVCSPELYTLRARPAGHVTGAKPPAFLTWLFHCLGARPGDELVDLFPGSGAVALAWEAFAQQLPLQDPADVDYAEDLGAAAEASA